MKNHRDHIFEIIDAAADSVGLLATVQRGDFDNTGTIFFSHPDQAAPVARLGYDFQPYYWSGRFKQSSNLTTEPDYTFQENYQESYPLQPRPESVVDGVFSRIMLELARATTFPNTVPRVTEITNKVFGPIESLYTGSTFGKGRCATCRKENAVIILPEEICGSCFLAIQ